MVLLKLARYGASLAAIAAVSAQAQTAEQTPAGDLSTRQQADPAATAQDNNTSTDDKADAQDIVVTGIRASLASALQQKRLAPNIVEVLAAEDIGKLPDNSIAESLARLPGLSTNRDRGNATSISIRGLSPELVNTLLNGRELVSAGPDRNIRYDSYPAELITGASVYKSPTASQVEGAIAGQVDLKTIRPLDYKSTQIVLNARGEYDDLGNDIVNDKHSTGWIGSASYVGQFANDTLGIAIGLSGRNEPVATERTNIYRYTNSFADLDGDGTGNDNVPYGFEALQRGGTDKRIGGLATIQWKPDDRAELRGDFFYSHVQYKEFQRGFSVQDLPFGNSFSDVTVEQGAAVDGSATNFADYGIQLQNNNQFYTYKDDLFAGGLNGVLHGDDWQLSSDLAYSKTTRHAEFLNIYTEAVNPDGTTNIDGVTVNWASHPGSPSSFSFNQSLTDPELNQVTNLEIPSNGNGAPIIHDELFSTKADFSYFTHGSWINTLSAGFRVASRSKDLTQRTQYGSIDPANRRPLPASLMLPDVTWSGDYAGLPNSMAIDVFGVADQLFGGIDPQQSVDDMRSSWKVDERTFAGYINADFEHPIGGMNLTGNIGVRVVRTEETSHGTHITQDPVTFEEFPSPITYRNNFTDWLPSLNATLHIDEHQQIRFALSKAIARAPLDDLNAGFAIYSGSPPSAYGGNPALEPYRAKQADLTYEHYFNADTAATVSLFYKKLDTYVVQQVSDLTVDGVTYDDAFHQPVNGHGGNIKGVEVSYQQAFSFLPKPLDGFGVYANYSYTDSNITVEEADNTIGNVALPGLSKNVYNLSLYFSKYGIDTRLAYRYRSHFSTQTGDTDRILVNHGEGILSYEFSYSFPDSSSLKGLKLLAQADNLTNAPYQLYYGDPALQGRYETFGRRYWLGASFKFCEALPRLIASALLVAATGGQAAPAPRPAFYFGADLSYVNEMEACGARYRVGKEKRDPFALFADHGNNLVRVRLWNDPDWTTYSTLADVEKTIARAKAQHMQVLLDFHYSDTWADGDKQIAPKAWAGITDPDALAQKLYQFTFDTLRALDAKGLMPEMVQIGNETNYALLGGKKGVPIDWSRNAKLFNAGIKATHDAGAKSSIDPRVMIHIAQPEHALPWFEAATRAGVTGYDQIGLSYYPKWSTYSFEELGWTIQRLRQIFAKDVMVVETAYPWTTDNADAAPNLLGEDSLAPGYPATPAGQQKYLVDLTQTVINAGGNGTVYWEPAWVSTGCKTPWATGSGWDNATFFDFHHGNALLPGIDFMRHHYTPPGG